MITSWWKRLPDFRSPAVPPPVNSSNADARGESGFGGYRPGGGRCSGCHLGALPGHVGIPAAVLQGYDAAVFTLADFVPPGLPIERVDIVQPAIDPESPKY